MKKFLLEITESGGRIHKDPQYIEENKDKENCFVNPDLSHLKGISPSYFTLKDGKIEAIPVEDREQHAFFIDVKRGLKTSSDGSIYYKKLPGVLEDRLSSLEKSQENFYEEIEELNRLIASTKAVFTFRISHIKDTINSNNRANYVRFVLVLLAVIALKLIKG